MVTLDGGLAEQIDRIRVGSGRVGAHTSVWFQAFASAHQEHLVRRDHAAFSLDRFLQLGDTAQMSNKKKKKKWKYSNHDKITNTLSLARFKKVEETKNAFLDISDVFVSQMQNEVDKLWKSQVWKFENVENFQRFSPRCADRMQ